MELKSADGEVEYKTVFNDDGTVKFVKKEDVERGRKSKRSGGTFEMRVRRDLEEDKNFIVDKWSNNLDLDNGEIVPCKRVFKRFGPGRGVMTIGTGFPDFVAFQKREDGNYKIIGVEVKISGILDRIEKKKCLWLLDNNVFSEIWVARKVKEKNRVHVKYTDFKEIAERMR